MIIRLSPVPVFKTILNLKFITVRWRLFSPRHGSEEDTAIQLVTIRDRFELQDKVSSRLFGFQKAGAVGDVDGSFLNSEFTLGTRNFSPAFQCLAIEQRGCSQRLQIDVSKLNLAPVHLQTDEPCREWLVRRVGVFEGRLSIELDGDFGTFDADMETVPVAITHDGGFRFGSLDQACRSERRVSVAHVQFVAVHSRVSRLQCGAQKDATVATLGEFVIASQFIISESRCRAE